MRASALPGPAVPALVSVSQSGWLAGRARAYRIALVRRIALVALAEALLTARTAMGSRVAAVRLLLVS